MSECDEKLNPEPVTDGETPVGRSLCVMANDLLEKSVQNDWQSVLTFVRKMTHESLGHGFFALAVTLKKLYWSLVPRLNESQARKYVLRTMWSLARAKRENDCQALIHRDPERYKFRKQGGTVIHLVKFHNFDPDAVIPPAHELTAVAPDAAHLLSQVDGETSNVRLRQPNHHDIIQPPHISLPAVSKVAEK